VTPPKVDETVHFEGSWSPDQQALLSNAIEDFETRWTGDRLLETAPAWVCVAYEVGRSMLFCAHRPYLPNVLAAESARGLARRVRDAG
jgi:hypothetical protein